MISLLSRDLYRQGPEVVIRELLRNAMEAVSARRLVDPEYEGLIELECVADGEGGYRLRIQDDGIGIREEDIPTTVGRMGTRALDADGDEKNPSNSSDRRGIGLLSGFILSDEIHVYSQSVDSSSGPFHWVGKRDGQWEMKPSPEDHDPGTLVYLDVDSAMAERLPLEQVKYDLHRYGQYLPVTLRYRWETGSTDIHEPPPWEKQYLQSRHCVRRGQEIFSEYFLGGFPFACEKTKAQGIAFIPSYSLREDEELLHRLYVRQMLESDRVRNLAPPDLPFLKCLVNANSLKLNAAKSDLHADETCSALHQSIRSAFDEYLRGLATEEPLLLTMVLGIHHSPMIALAESSDAIFRLMMEHYLLSTSLGPRSPLTVIGETDGEILYTRDRDDYDLLEPCAILKGITVVKATDAMVYEFLDFLKRRRPELTIRKTSSNELLREIQKEVSIPPDTEELFLRLAELELETEHTKVSLIEDEEATALGKLVIQCEERVLRALFHESEEKPEKGGKKRQRNFESFGKNLALNRNHPAISSMLRTSDARPDRIRGWVRVFYHHLLLAAGEDPSSEEMERYAEGLVVLWGDRGFSNADKPDFPKTPAFVPMPGSGPEPGAEVWAKETPPAKALDDLRWVLQNDSASHAVAHRWFTYVMIVRTQGQDRFVGTLAYWILKNWEKKGIDATAGMDETRRSCLLRTLAISIPIAADDPRVSVEQISYLQDSLFRLAPKEDIGSLDHVLFPLAIHRQLGRPPSRDHLSLVTEHWDQILAGNPGCQTTTADPDASGETEETQPDEELSLLFCNTAIAQIMIEALITLGEIDEAISLAKEATSLKPCLFFCDFAPKGFLARLLEPLLERGEVHLAREWEEKLASTIHSPEGALAETGYRAVYLAQYGEMDRALELLKEGLPHTKNKNVSPWKKLEFYRGASRALVLLEMETGSEQAEIVELERAFTKRNLGDSEISAVT